MSPHTSRGQGNQQSSSPISDLIEQDIRGYERMVLGCYLHHRQMALRLESAGILQLEWDSIEHKALANAIHQYHQATGYACGSQVSAPLLQSALLQHASTQFDITPEMVPAALNTLSRASTEVHSGFSSALAFMEQSIPSWVVRQRMHSLLSETRGDYRQALERLHTDTASLAIMWTGKDNPLAAGKLVNPLAVARKEREPVFVQLPWNSVNAQMDGGVRRSDKIMILGATGAGKSVLSSQIAGHLTRARNKLGVYVFTEDEHVDYLDRVVASSANIDFSLLRQGIFNPNLNVSDKIRQEASNAYHELDPHHNNFSQGLFLLKFPTGEDMTGVLEDAIEHVARMAGRVPDFLIVDWLREQLVRGGRNEETRDRLNRAADAVAEVGDSHRILTIATAQVNVNGRERIKAVSEEHLQNSKQMTRLYTVVMGISCLASVEVSSDEDVDVRTTYLDDQFLNISKLRYGRTGLIKVKRNYAKQRLEVRG